MNKFNQETEIKISNLYVDGSSMSQLANQFECCVATIQRILKTYSIKSRQVGNCRRYSLNENYFNKITTEEQAYFLGFIFADGHMTKDGYSLIIHIHKQDEEILKRFKELLGYSGPINQRAATETSGESVCLQITSKQVVRDLNKIGIVNNKTKYPEVPKIPHKLFPHFLRGMNDGDGNIYVKNKDDGRIISSVTLLSHKLIHKYIKQQVLLDLDKFTIYEKTHPNTNYIKIFYIGGNKNVLQFLNYIYSNDTAKIYLTRKYLKYKQILEYFNEFYFQPNKYRGVWFSSTRNKFDAYISSKGKKKHLGSFKTSKEAAKAYNLAAIKLLGNSAILNNIS